jgi:HD superfamily phosphodiesterase
MEIAAPVMRSWVVRAMALLALAGAALASGAAAAPQPEKAHPQDWRATVHRFAAIHLKHPAWGLSHSERDYDLARALAAADRVVLDDDVLYAAAYLHDVAAFAPYEKESVDHADEAARIVDTLLEDTGFPMAKIEAVRGAIRTHMFTREPVGPEAIYLHDADALDWLGAIGVARIFGLVDPQGGAPDGPRAVKMLQENLAKVPPRVLSPAGRARLPERTHELQEFLKSLSAESGDFHTL